jgi:hypothetical protein
MAHWPEFDVPQAPLVCGVVQVPGDPAVESHHRPARHGQFPPASDSALQTWVSQVNPGAHWSDAQLWPASAKAWQVPGQVLAVELHQPVAQSSSR